MSVSVAMRIYIFHDHPFQVLVMSPFFCSRQPYDEVTLDDIRPYFQPLKYPTDDVTDSNTCLTPIVSLDSDPSEPSYPSYHVEIDPSEPSYPSVIHLMSDLSSSSTAPRHTPPPIRGRGFIRTHAMPRGHGHARGGGHSDVAPGGFGNGYLSPDE